MLTPVEEIKSKLDIVDIIQEYFPLKQSGANYKALCPFHSEKTPSFMVSREKQFFKCFGCGESGDIFTFIQKMENVEFPEALRILANKAGVQLRQTNYNPQMQNLKTRLYDLHKAAVEFYQGQFFNLPAAKNAREYLINQRKLNKDIINEFQLGYAPDSWDGVSRFLKSKGFFDNEILQSGLAVEKKSISPNSRNYYDRFRDRIMFPIRDHHGNVVGFTGRAMKDDPETSGAKYINTPQTVIYNKSQILYGLYKAKNEIRKNNLAILVEGNMDVIASHQMGIKNAVASSGTSLTLDQIKILRRYTTNIALAFDADAAGVAAAERGIELIWQQGISVKVIILPSGVKDPDELIKKSPDAWREAIEKRVNFMDYLLQVNLANEDLDDVDVKRDISAKILPWIAKLNNLIEQDYYLKKIANQLEINENSLREELNKIKRLYQNKNKYASKTDVKRTPAINRQIDKYQIVSQRLLALIIYEPSYIKEAVALLPPELLEGGFQEFYKQLIFYYTKNDELLLDDFYQYLQAEKKDLAFVFDTLKLLAETEFVELDSLNLNKEFNLAANWLKKAYISKKLKQIEKDIRQAEQMGDRQKADELMREFSNLSRDLAGL